MAFKFNPLSSLGLDYYQGGYSEVNTYADLPSAVGLSGAKYLVLTSTGTWILGTKKDAGLYYSNGTTWSLMPSIQDYFYASDFAIKNANGFNLQFNVTALTANKTITIPDSDLNLTNVVTGTGLNFRIANWTGVNTLGYNTNLYTNGSNLRINDFNQLTSSDYPLQVTSTTSANSVFVSNAAYSSNGGAFNIIGAARGSATTSGSRLGALGFFGQYGTGATETYTGAVISSFSSQAYTSSNRGTEMQFEVTPNNTTARSAVLRILNNGATNLLSTYPLYLGGTGTGSDYGTSTNFDGISEIHKPRVDGLAYRWLNAAGSTEFLSINSSTSEVLINGNPSLTGTGASVQYQIPVFTGTGNQVAGSSGLITTSGYRLGLGNGGTVTWGVQLLNTRLEERFFGILNNTAGSFGFSVGASSASPNLSDIVRYGSAHATTAYRSKLMIKNLVSDILLSPTGAVELMGTNQFRLGGTGTGSDYTHSITGGSVTMAIKPLVDDVNAVQFQNANNTTKVLVVDTTNARIGVNTVSPSDTLDVLGTARFGDHTTNYTQFEADGSMLMVGSATVFDDVYPSSVTIGSGGSAPSFTAYNGNLRAYEFLGSGATTKELNMGFQIPHSYKEGSTIVPHIHLYIPDDGTGGVIKFYCEYTWTNVNQTGTTATTTTSGTITRVANEGINNNAILSFGEIVGTGKTMSSVFMCRIYRNPADAADTFGVSCWLKSADIHIEMDTLGSRQILTK